MQKFIVFFVLLCLHRVLGHSPDVYEFCSGVLKGEPSLAHGCDPRSCQGRPGKRGIVGPMGPKGERGEMGDERILRQEIEKLKGKN